MPYNVTFMGTMLCAAAREAKESAATMPYVMLSLRQQQQQGWAPQKRAAFFSRELIVGQQMSLCLTGAVVWTLPWM